MRRVGAVAPAAGRKREDNPHSLQPCVSGHGGIGGRRSSGRGKVQAAIGPRLRFMGNSLGCQQKYFFFNERSLVTKASDYESSRYMRLRSLFSMG